MEWRNTVNVTRHSAVEARQWWSKYLCQFQKYGSRGYWCDFWEKGTRQGLDTKLEKFSERRSTDQRHKSGRPKHVLTEENVITVGELVGLLNQKGQTQTHRWTRQISKKMGLTLCSIHHADNSPRLWSEVSFVCQHACCLLFYHVSHSSVVTLLMCGGTFSNNFIVNSLQTASEKKLKTGWYLAKIWAMTSGKFFSDPVHLYIR